MGRRHWPRAIDDAAAPSVKGCPPCRSVMRAGIAATRLSCHGASSGPAATEDLKATAGGRLWGRPWGRPTRAAAFYHPRTTPSNLATRPYRDLPPGPRRPDCQPTRSGLQATAQAAASSPKRRAQPSSNLQREGIESGRHARAGDQLPPRALRSAVSICQGEARMLTTLLTGWWWRPWLGEIHRRADACGEELGWLCHYVDGSVIRATSTPLVPAIALGAGCGKGIAPPPDAALGAVGVE